MDQQLIDEYESTILRAPNGSLIKGTYDKVPGCALAKVTRSPDGSIELDWDGETDMFWDDQKTVQWKNPDTGLLEDVYVAEDGELWRESQLVDPSSEPNETA